MDTFWSIFLYSSNWNLKLNLIFVTIAAFYLWFTRRGVSARQRSTFLFAMIFYYCALGSPLDLLGHDLFSMHMLQMSILYFMLPPLLLLGIPRSGWLWLLKITYLRKIAKCATRPIIALILFHGAISLYHVPYVFDAIMASYALHIFSHTVLLLFALCLWWPIVAPLPEYDKVKPLHKLAYVCAGGVLLTPACAMITFTDQVLFAQYKNLSQLAPILSPIHDQQLGGIIMKIVQEIVYIVAIVVILRKWMAQEAQRDETIALNWEENKLL